MTEPNDDDPRPDVAEPALFGLVNRERRLSDKVADMMLETILSDRLQVGDRLPSERELGEQFGVSRTVVREAIRALVTKGVIDVRSGSGASSGAGSTLFSTGSDSPVSAASSVRSSAASSNRASAGTRWWERRRSQQ